METHDPRNEKNGRYATVDEALHSLTFVCFFSLIRASVVITNVRQVYSGIEKKLRHEVAFERRLG